MTIEDMAAHFEVASGVVQRGRVSLFSIFRDEMFFCEAFFRHYRAMGIEQFIIIDDKSVDGTGEFLRSQPDCVVLDWDMHFGDDLRFILPDGQSVDARAGNCIKTAVPQLLLKDEYVTYVDADEFLILPEGVSSIQEVIRRLSASGTTGVLSSVVEFFPGRRSDLDAPHQPQSFEDLVARYPYFESEPLLTLRPDGTYCFANQSKGMTLYDQFLPKHDGKKSIKYCHTPRHKTPVLMHSDKSYMLDSHKCNLPVAPDLMLTMAHFVYTARLQQKCERALRWRSYGRVTKKYDAYKKLLEMMSHGDQSFLSQCSERFTRPQQFVAAGLMRWDSHDESDQINTWSSTRQPIHAESMQGRGVQA